MNSFECTKIYSRYCFLDNLNEENRKHAITSTTTKLIGQKCFNYQHSHKKQIVWKHGPS